MSNQTRLAIVFVRRAGMEHVIVNGTPVVGNARLVEGVSPGLGIRAPIR